MRHSLTSILGTFPRYNRTMRLATCPAKLVLLEAVSPVTGAPIARPNGADLESVGCDYFDAVWNWVRKSTAQRREADLNPFRRMCLARRQNVAKFLSRPSSRKSVCLALMPRWFCSSADVAGGARTWEPGSTDSLLSVGGPQ